MPLSPIFLLLILLAGLTVLAAAGHIFLRPRMVLWGASAEEARRSLPGDELISDPILNTTRAILINAAPEKIWPWLVQMGQSRGGFYSYDRLEKLVGMDIHNTRQIIPELQNLQPGDLIPFWRGAGVNVVIVEPPRLLVLAGTINNHQGAEATPAEAGGTWVFSLEPAGVEGTRLIVRARAAKFPPAWLSAIFMLLLEPMHFVMERKMMLRIKDLAERG